MDGRSETNIPHNNFIVWGYNNTMKFRIYSLQNVAPYLEFNVHLESSEAIGNHSNAWCDKAKDGIHLNPP